MLSDRTGEIYLASFLKIDKAFANGTYFRKKSINSIFDPGFTFIVMCLQSVSQKKKEIVLGFDDLNPVLFSVSKIVLESFSDRRP